MQNILELIGQKKHVIWDWNGTLLDDLDHVLQVINDILQDHNLTTIDHTTYREVFGFPVKNYYQRLGFDFSHHDFEKLSYRFVDQYMAGVHQCGLFEHSKKLIQAVKQDLGLKQSILSASDQESLDFVVKHFQVGHLFDHVAGISDKFASSKLRRGFELLDVSGVSAEDSVLIGDTDHDLEVGQKLGLEVILIAHGHQSEERLKKVHDKVFKI